MNNTTNCCVQILNDIENPPKKTKNMIFNITMSNSIKYFKK